MGLYLPTSLNGHILKIFSVSYFFILLIFTLVLLMLQRKISIIMVFIGTGIILTLFLSTFIFSLKFGSTYAFGGLMPYANIVLLFCLNFSDLSISKQVNKVFFVTNVINIIAIFLIFIQPDITHLFLTCFYSWGNQELVIRMLARNKPVFTFAMHSIAGFFFFLFFLLNIETYRSKEHIIYLIYALCYLIFIVLLKSTTAYCFIIVASLYICYRFIYFIPVFITGTATFVLFNNGVVSTLFNHVVTVFLSPTNGFLGRFSSHGAFQETLSYIMDNPFSPVGLGYLEFLHFTDSGFIVHLLRGSLLLVILMYLGFFMFLRYNIKRKDILLLLFSITLMFSLGHVPLLYIRTLYTLPFIVVYLNNLPVPSRTNQKYFCKQFAE